MLKKAWLAIFSLVMATSLAYAAPDRTGKSDIGLNVSGTIPDDSGVDGSVYVGGSWAYGVSNWLAVGVESGYTQFEDSDAGITVEQDAISVLGDIILRVPLEHQAQPYAIVGLGVLISDFDINVANIEADSDASFAVKFGGGVDWFVNDNWILNFEGSYVASDTDTVVRNTSTGASLAAQGESDYWMVGGGLKYLF